MTLRTFEFARIGGLALLACFGFAGQAVGQPGGPVICNEVLTIIEEEDEAHLNIGQQFLFVGPVGPNKYITVTPLPNGIPETVGPGDHVATWLSGDINQDPDESVQKAWIYEWAAPVSTDKHQPVRVHLYDMKVTDAKQVPPTSGKLCPSKVEFWSRCHPEECSEDLDPGHATAN